MWGLILAWIIVVVVPVLLLHTVLLTVLSEDEKRLQIQAREELSREMAAFQSDLNVPDQIGMRFHLLDAAIRRSLKGDIRRSDSTHPGWQRPVITASEIAGLFRRHFNVSPLLVAVGEERSGSGENFTFYANPRRFDDLHRPSAKAMFSLLAYHAGLEDAQSSPGLVRRAYSVILGSNKPADPFPGAPLAFVSTKFGGGFFHLFGTRLHIKGRPGRAYMIVLREDDLSPANILGFARGRCANSGVKRTFIAPMCLRLTVFRRSSRGLFLLDHLPYRVSRLGESRGVSLLNRFDNGPNQKGVGSDSPPIDFPHPVAAVLKPQRLLEHPVRLALPVLDAFFFLGCLVGCALLLRAHGSHFESHLKLRTRLAVAIAAAVVPPIAGFWLVGISFAQFSDRLERVQVIDRMVERLEGFERALTARESVLVGLFWEIRNRVEASISDTPASLARLLFDAGNLDGINRLFLFRSDGLEVNEIPVAAHAELKRLESEGHRASAERKTLSSMRAVAIRSFLESGTTSRETYERWKRERRIDRMTQESIEFLSTEKILGILDDSGSQLRVAFPGLESASMISFMITSPGSHFMPIAMFYASFNRERVGKSFFRRLSTRPGEFLDQFGRFEIRCAVFPLIRSVGSLGYPSFEARRPDIIQAAETSRRLRGVWQSERESSDGPVIRAGKMFVDHPFIAVATAHSRFGGGCVWENMGIFGGLAIYSFLVVGLLATLLSRMFAEPLEEVRRAVLSIGAGDVRIRPNVGGADEFGELAIAVGNMAQGLLERERMTRFVSARLVQAVHETGGEALNARGESLEVAVLFSDIRGFTTLTEKNPAEAIVELLNAYFDAMEKPIIAEDGVIDRFIGDAIQAVFYPLRPEHASQNDPAQRAARAALAMRVQLRAFNEARERAGQFVIATGIGIARGRVTAGRIGSKFGRLDETVVGDVPAQASRYESLSRYGTESRIIIGAAEKSFLTQIVQIKPLPFPEEVDQEFAQSLFELVEARSSGSGALSEVGQEPGLLRPEVLEPGLLKPEIHETGLLRPENFGPGSGKP
ncbi:MAG: adenylate/guanylate cyclase domain-containing protein [Candidatus Ozemobacteraceae bacterium]